MNKNKLRENFRKLLFEFILITLGVLIALMINSFQDARKASKQRDRNLQLVLTKSKENISNLDWVLKEHTRFVDSLAAHLNDTLNVMEIVQLVDGFKSDDVKTIKSSVAFSSDRDFELMLKIEDIDISIQNKNYLGEKVKTLLLDNVNNSSYSEKEKLMIHLQYYLHQIEVLKTQYEKLVKYIAENELK